MYDICHERPSFYLISKTKKANMSNSKKLISRRRFLQSMAMGAAGLAFVPSLFTGCKSTSSSGKIGNDKTNTLRVGFIGLGQQATWLLKGFITIPGVEVVAGCDVYGVKRLRFEKKVKAYYAKTENKSVQVDLYEKYTDLLARKDIDTVVIATPDHSHAMIAIAACRAKKNIYLEKPLTFTIKEGQELIKAVRDNKVILAVGSQQRSDPNFQHAVKMVQEGKLGKLQRINAYVGAPPKPYDLPEQPIPSDLNWTLWQQPLPYPIHYNAELNPPITIDPEQNEQFWGAWRWYKEMGGGFTTDWGAHMFDIAQWGMGMDKNGPVEIIPAGYNGTQFLTFKYENGVILTEEPFNDAKTKGVKFWGDNGWIEVSRGHYKASDPSLLPPKVEKKDNTPYETQVPHYMNFINAIHSKTDPIVPVEIGHSTCTVCTLGNMAYDLMRPLKWNPIKQQFIDDPEASKHHLYSGSYSKG